MKGHAMRKLLCFGLLLIAIYVVVALGEGRAATNDAAAIPWNQIGAKAGADYKGDGLAVAPTESGTRLHCVFQRLDGEATSQGLWLNSTVTNTFNDRFRVTAMKIGRRSAKAGFDSQDADFSLQLAAEGGVSVNGRTVRFSRPGLTEEYSVSMDGVRQDFIVEQSPPNPLAGELVVKLALAGAKVEPAAYGVRLVLENSGRKIAYSRLRVTDATGKELSARIEVCPADDETPSLTSWGESCRLFEPASLLTGVATEPQEALAVVVDDTDAVYPVQIDPTFSDTNWISLGGILGVDGEVYSEVVDGVGDVYVGGRFSIGGNVFANSVAKWNGSSWSALGSGIDGDVYALALSGTNLYVGGIFTNAGGVSATNVALWNGSYWSPLSSGISGSSPAGYAAVNALAVSGTNLYVGGDFANAGGVPASNIAEWNGSAWSALGPEPWASDEAVSALAVSGNTLFAGGSFDYFSQNGQVVYGIIYQWSGSSWSPVGTGLPYHAYVDVFALAASGTNLFAGGSFGTSGVSFVAQWNGISWSDLGLDTGGLVNSLAVSGTNLYVGGAFTNVGEVLATNIATWNGSSWSPLGSGISGGFNGPFVDALAVSGTNLFAGGSFYAAGNLSASSIAYWNGSSWSALGSGIGYNAVDDAQVSALAVSGDILYVGGIFSTMGNAPANNIAEWNGKIWSPLGMGITGAGADGIGPHVTALAAAGSNLYVGGDFSNAGGGTANSIVQWNGTSWSTLGSGISDGGLYGYGSAVNAMAVSGTNLYVGGNFANAGGIAASNIAQWNGESWSPLTSGINGFVYALAASGTNLYAGGYFTEAGGVAATNIAIWNGTSWSSLRAGRPSSINALAVSGPNLYVGGNFGAIGGVAANDIAQWNGTSWSALGSGILGTLGPSVYAIEVFGTNLFAAGNFSSAGGLSVNNIAEWNGNAW
jgi:hypothetical protein